MLSGFMTKSVPPNIAKHTVLASPDATRNVPSLAEVQAAFQRAILAGDDAVLSLIPGNGRTTNDVLFGVYRNAYTGRLIEVIASEHEQLKAYLGDEAFRSMAQAFIAAHPSKTQNARWFSDPLPGFLATAEPYASHPQLSELARLERTLAAAFDAADADVIELAHLQAIDPEQWERLVFTPHPAVRVLPMTSNALAIWSALKNGIDVPDASTFDQPKPVLIWRQGATPMVREMSAEEAMTWAEAVNGVTFGRLCELLAVFDDPDTAPLRAAQHLAGWLGSGMLSAVTLTKPKRRRKM